MRDAARRALGIKLRSGETCLEAGQKKDVSMGKWEIMTTLIPRSKRKFKPEVAPAHFDSYCTGPAAQKQVLKICWNFLAALAGARRKPMSCLQYMVQSVFRIAKVSHVKALYWRIRSRELCVPHVGSEVFTLRAFNGWEPGRCEGKSCVSCVCLTKWTESVSFLVHIPCIQISPFDSFRWGTRINWLFP